MPRVCGTHHVLCVEHLLCQLRHSECTILLRTTGSQRCKSCHKKVKPGKWYQIHCYLSQIAVQLSWKAQTCRHTTHSCRDKVIQITIRWRSQLQSPEADIVQGFVVEQHAFIRVLHQLMER